MIALWTALALAEPTALDLSSWMEAGAEVGPDLDGRSGVREQARLHLELGWRDWDLVTDGGFRFRRSPYDEPRIDLHRLEVAGRAAAGDLSLGRLVRLDARGFQRLDGLTFALDPGTALAGEVWAGRLWSAETWSTGETWVGGGELAWRPGRDGPSRTRRLAVGLEGRFGGDDLAARLHASGAIFSPRGESASALVEVEPAAETRWRGELRGELPVGRVTDVGAELRWEGLRPPTAPEEVRTPIDWLGRDGYAVASAFGHARGRRWDARVDGGPTWIPGERLGALGRAGLGWRGAGAVGAGLFASGAVVGGTWFAGGGGGLSWTGSPLPATLDVGTWRFQGVDGDAAWIWELRGASDVDLSRRLGLAFDAAVGTNRQLKAYVRGGLTLRGAIAGRER